MGYVDHTERRERRQIRQREDYAREEIRLGDFLYDLKNNPYFSLAAAFGIGVPASWIPIGSFVFGFGFYGGLETLLLVLVPMLPSAALTWRGLRQFRRWGRRGTGPKLGSEKQLLLTIATSGGSITPVEAALETSLTVDEAEEILSRLADRGHLIVQSHEGALFYTLPGRSSGTLGERTAPQF